LVSAAKTCLSWLAEVDTEGQGGGARSLGVHALMKNDRKHPKPHVIQQFTCSTYKRLDLLCHSVFGGLWVTG